jgi:hypothetical protein
MTDHSAGDHNTSPSTMVGIDGNRSMTVSVDQIVVGEGWRPINDVTVGKFGRSIGLLGLLCPLLVRRRERPDGKEVYQLIAGWGRLREMMLRGIVDAPCIVLERRDTLDVELDAIDENFRNDPGPAEHALLTAHRREIIRASAAQEGTPSQDATPSRQAKRRAGQKTGPDAASLRDQANKTGESKDKIQRSIKRFEILGRPLLESIIGTSLDNGKQLDALMKLPETIRDELSRRAAGEAVFATEVLRENMPAAKTGPPKEELPKEKPEDEWASNVEQVIHELSYWLYRCSPLLEENGVLDQAHEFCSAMRNALCPPDEDDASEQVNERPKNNWFNFLKGRGVG